MRIHRYAALIALAAGSALAAPSNAVIVTVETSKGAPKGSPVTPLTAHDVIARVDNQPSTVIDWQAVRNNPAGLELWIMIDDGTDSRLGIQIDDLRNFIRQQPPSTKVAIGYLRNGSVQTLQAPTAEHDAAAKAIRLPTGIPGISASPYIALADFLHKLRPLPVQPREILLVSSGIDPYYGPGPQNPYLQNAIHDSQKAGVPIHSIYFSSAGHAGHSYWLINWGQNDLSQLSDETGGEFYWEGNSNPVAFKPYLDALNRRLAEQYVVTLDTPKPHSGFDRLQLHTESPKISLVGPAQIYTPK